jgi:phosphomannomutase
MQMPKLTVSGYRGVWNETLTLPIARSLATRFGMYIRSTGAQTILVGRDARTSGSAISTEVIEALRTCGLAVVDIGLVATPSVLYLVRQGKADGAVIITASHNPIEYNGLKFVMQGGRFTNEEDVAHIIQMPDMPQTTAHGTYTKDITLPNLHIEKILSVVDTKAIQSAHLHVALDPINSVGALYTPLLLEKLGVTYSAINASADGNFAHEPEPLPKNLSDLGTLVQTSGAQAGFAQDPDADRLVLVDEHGVVLSEVVPITP